MTTPTMKTERSHLPRPWWVQAAKLSVSSTILICVILVSAGYPGEHWPIAAATIVMTVFGASFFTEIAILFAFKRLRSYRNSVFRKHNLEWKETDTEAQRRRGTAMAIAGVLTLSYAVAIWGAALYAFQWTAQPSNLPPMANTVYSVGLIALIAGAIIVTTLIVVSFGMVALVDRLSDPAQPIPPVIRWIYKAAKFISAASQQPLPSFIFQPSRAT